MKIDDGMSKIRIKNLKELYEIYPILSKINHKNKDIIDEKAFFKTIYADEFINSEEGTCPGILFVLKGSIKIQKVNEAGEVTNLYNIKQGEFCHEVLSCLSNFESLNITGKAVQDSEVCIMPIDIMKQYIMNDSEFLMYIYKDLYTKFRTIIVNKEAIIHDSLESRLIKLLINKKSSIIYSTHNELALEIDSAREVVSRKLKQLEKKGYIKLERGKILVIKDLNDIFN